MSKRKRRLVAVVMPRVGSCMLIFARHSQMAANARARARAKDCARITSTFLGRLVRGASSDCISFLSPHLSLHWTRSAAGRVDSFASRGHRLKDGRLRRLPSLLCARARVTFSRRCDSNNFACFSKRHFCAKTKTQILLYAIKTTLVVVVALLTHKYERALICAAAACARIIANLSSLAKPLNLLRPSFNFIHYFLYSTHPE